MALPNAVTSFFASRRFRPGRWPTLATVAFVILTVALGNWQRHRAGEKEALDGFEFLTMAEAGEVGHWEILGTLNRRAGKNEVSELVDDELDAREVVHSPVNFASRFSRNAAMPSTMSGDVVARAWKCRAPVDASKRYTAPACAAPLLPARRHSCGTSSSPTAPASSGSVPRKIPQTKITSAVSAAASANVIWKPRASFRR